MRYSWADKFVSGTEKKWNDGNSFTSSTKACLKWNRWISAFWQMHMRIELNNEYFPCSAAYLQSGRRGNTSQMNLKYKRICFKHERHYNNPHRNFILKPDKVKPHYSQMDHKQNELSNGVSFSFKSGSQAGKVDFNSDKWCINDE